MNESFERRTGRIEITSYLIAGLALLLILKLHLLSALIAGLLVYDVVQFLAPERRIARLSGQRIKLVVITLIAVTVILVLIVGTWGIVAFFRSDAGSVPALLQKLAEIIEESRKSFPPWLIVYLPEDVQHVKDGTLRWLRLHDAQVMSAGREAGRTVAYVLVGMVIGALLSLREAVPPSERGPLGAALMERSWRLSQAFRAIVFAQVRIAALNSLFAWIYLSVMLPFFGVHLPLVKTMVVVTFVTGLLPIVGNLASNMVVVIVSLSHSPAVSLGSLAFLVAVHKMEYFLNARIIGGRINASAWELLLAMLAMEAAFGLPGVLAAPIYYAYLKRELSDGGLV